MMVDDSRWSTLGENSLHLGLEVCNRPLCLGTRCARDDHTVKTVSSCMSSLAQINRAKHAFDKDLPIATIKGLLFSKMFYCSSVWSNISVTNINKLQAIQNFAAPPMTKSKKFDHITPILKPLGWMPVKYQLFYRDALLTF